MTVLKEHPADKELLNPQLRPQLRTHGLRTLHLFVSPRNRKAASKTKTRTGNLQSWSSWHQGPKKSSVPNVNTCPASKSSQAIHIQNDALPWPTIGLPFFFSHVKLAGSCGCSLWQYSEHGVAPPRKRTTTFDQSPFWMFIPQNLVFIGWQRDAYPQGAGQSPHFLPKGIYHSHRTCISSRPSGCFRCLCLQVYRKLLGRPEILTCGKPNMSQSQISQIKTELLPKSEF